MSTAENPDISGQSPAEADQPIALIAQLAASTVLEDHGFERALQEISEIGARLLKVDRISIWLSMEDRQFVQAVDIFDVRKNFHSQGDIIDLSMRSSYLEILGKQHVLAIDDTETDGRIDDIRETVLRPRNIRALIDASIWRDGKFAGSLVASKQDGPRQWRNEDSMVAGVLVEFVVLLLEKQERRDSEQRFRDWAEASSDGYWELDAELRYTEVVSKFLEDWGLVPQKIIGKRRWEVPSAETDPHFWDDHIAMLEARQPFFDFRYRTQLRTGEVRTVSINGKPIFSQDQTFLGYRGSVIDVSDLVTIEEIRSEGDARYRSVLDLSPDGILIVKQGLVEYANRAAAEIFGAPFLGDLLGIEADRLCSPEDLAKAHERRGRILEGRHNLTPWESTGIRLDGDPVAIETLGAPLPGNDSQAMQIIVRDISARKQGEVRLRRVEDALRQSQKMEAVGQLTGGVAHDFNNLLAVIMGNAELILESIDDPDDPVLQLAEAVERAASRGAELTQHLLAFSRKQALVPKTIELTKELEGLSRILSRALGETFDVEIIKPTDLWSALVDSSQLENALLNLALNARDAMPAGGRVTIEASNVVASEDGDIDLAPGPYVLLAITDNGVGMEAEMIEHAFEPFYTTKDVGKGTGLGLSMVFGFAKQSNGHVCVESEVGVGTTVKLYLPKSGDLPDLETSARIAVPDTQNRDEVVLILEDRPDVRSLVVSLVETLGYRSLQAEDGPAALGVLQENPHVDVLLSDVILPAGMAGPEVVRRALVLHPGLKVIFMSGFTDDEMLSSIRSEPNTIMLKKPFRLAELGTALEQVLARQS
jgi:PAS domain S-box-containing protein